MNTRIFFIALLTLCMAWGCSDDSEEVINDKDDTTEVDDKNDDPDNTGGDTGEASALERELFDLVNAHRASKGLDALQFSDAIYTQSLSHSKAMAKGTVDFGHDGFSERVDNIRQTMAVRTSAENVANGFRGAQATLNGWLGSSGHRKNIEGNYTQSAIGIAFTSNGTPYYTQIFIR